jgi:3-phenylpropionate/cinnamic acid dioxygenase small subunit
MRKCVKRFDNLVARLFGKLLGLSGRRGSNCLIFGRSVAEQTEVVRLMKELSAHRCQERRAGRKEEKVNMNVFTYRLRSFSVFTTATRIFCVPEESGSVAFESRAVLRDGDRVGRAPSSRVELG